MSTTMTASSSWYRGNYVIGAGYYGVDGAPIVSRHKFHTPNTGATTVSWRSSEFYTLKDYNYKDSGANFIITTQSTGYEWHQGSDGNRAWQSDGHLVGSLDVQLMPDTDYYLWIWPRDNVYCRVRMGTTVQVTVDGIYGTPSTVSAADGSFGSSISVNLNAMAAGAIHTVSVNCAGRTETLLSDSSATSCVWSPDLETYARLIPNSGSAQATITCETKYGGNSVGTASTTITVSLPAGSAAPVVTEGWATAIPYNTGAAAGITVYVQGYSVAEVRFDQSKIACQYGASITGYRIRCGSVEADSAPYRTGVLTGDAQIVCTVIDSRGQETSEAMTVTVTAYANPAITEVSVFRCDSSGAADDAGQFYSAKGRVIFSSLNGENSMSLTTACKLHSAASYGAETALQNNTVQVIGGLSADSSYNIRLKATDRLGNEAIVTVALATQTWAMKFRPDGMGVGFGKAPEHSKCIEIPSDWVIRIGDKIITGD